ncbi:MAG: nucleoside kinase [Anaerolineae bacterium]
MSTHQNSSSIIRAAPRERVRVTLPDSIVLEGPIHSPIGDFLRAHREIAPDQYKGPFIGGIIEGRLRELSYPVRRDSTLAPVLMNSSDGRRIYRRTLSLLLTAAANELFPDARINVSYALPEGGMFCFVTGRDAFNDDEIAQLEAHMRTIAAADEPIRKEVVPIEQAVALFRARQADDKVRLLEQRKRDTLTLYTLRGWADYFYGYMLTSTGDCTLFRLQRMRDGFVLQHPVRGALDALPQISDSASKIIAVFEDTEELLRRLEVQDIGRLNQLVRENRSQELVLVSEANHEAHISAIARDIYAANQSRGLRLVTVAGPSSSGKTTFSRRLSVYLLSLGLRPYALELDNYFVDRERTPLDEDGHYNFEALEAIDRALLNEQMRQLVNGEKVQIPHFDFKSGKRAPGQSVQLAQNQVLIIEGIHGLNPNLIPDIPRDQVFRVYVSALTQLNLDSSNRIPTTDVRILRRIARDAVQRGNDARETIERWPSVRRGEHRYIFPYQENADVIFNSTLIYELAALRPLVEPLLLQIEYGTQAHIEAKRLLSFLYWVQPMNDAQRALIPDTSILREFIGGSVLANYIPGSHLANGNTIES